VIVNQVNFTESIMGIFFVARDRGTVKPAAPFTPEVAVERLHKAFEGIGTNDDLFIEVATKHNYEQRVTIKATYKGKYGKDLISKIKSELTGHYQDTAVAMFTDPEEFIVENIHEAIKGIGTDEQSLIGLLVGRSNEEMEAIRKEYFKKYNKALEEVLRGELSGDFRKLMIAVILAKRDHNLVVELVKAEADARRLHTGGIKLGDDSIFEQILTTRSYPQLRATFESFKKVAGIDIKDAIKKEYSGDMEDGLCALVDCIRSEAEFFAHHLHNAFKGAGTDDKKLIRIVVLRSEIDMQDIKVAYQAAYKKSLADSIKSETSKDYRKLLLHLID